MVRGIKCKAESEPQGPATLFQCFFSAVMQSLAKSVFCTNIYCETFLQQSCTSFPLFLPSPYHNTLKVEQSALQPKHDCYHSENTNVVVVWNFEVMFKKFKADQNKFN